jgi:uncharacterized protein with HEPN domain
MKSDMLYLRHILDSIAQIDEYLSGKSFAAFKRGSLLQDGAIRQLAFWARRPGGFPPALQQSYPAVPWADPIGMRNILIHDYVDVDVGEVWKTVHDDLPLLREQIGQILDTMTAGSC